MQCLFSETAVTEGTKRRSPSRKLLNIIQLLNVNVNSFNSLVGLPVAPLRGPILVPVGPIFREANGCL